MPDSNYKYIHTYVHAYTYFTYHHPRTRKNLSEKKFTVSSVCTFDAAVNCKQKLKALNGNSKSFLYILTFHGIFSKSDWNEKIFI